MMQRPKGSDREPSTDRCCGKKSCRTRYHCQVMVSNHQISVLSSKVGTMWARCGHNVVIRPGTAVASGLQRSDGRLLERSSREPQTACGICSSAAYSSLVTCTLWLFIWQASQKNYKTKMVSSEDTHPPVHPSIHPSIRLSFNDLVKSWGSLECITGSTGHKAGDPLDRMPVRRRLNKLVNNVNKIACTTCVALGSSASF